jgi:hypothetical protein
MKNPAMLLSRRDARTLLGIATLLPRGAAFLVTLNSRLVEFKSSGVIEIDCLVAGTHATERYSNHEEFRRAYAI